MALVLLGELIVAVILFRGTRFLSVCLNVGHPQLGAYVAPEALNFCRVPYLAMES
jgi:hypothetical protein